MGGYIIVHRCMHKFVHVHKETKGQPLELGVVSPETLSTFLLGLFCFVLFVLF